MSDFRTYLRRGILLSILGLFQSPLAAAGAGTIEGTVLSADGSPAHHAAVLVVETGQTVETDHEGHFRFESVPEGSYDLFAYVASLTSQAKLVTVTPGQVAQVELSLEILAVHENVTVTSSNRHETTFQAVQSVTSLDSFTLAENSAPSIGEVLDGQLGVAKRSFGPGSARPVIRGFDGDRVLVMSDGLPVGSLGSQSGDHAEPIDPISLERLEVVKGPATLLYGSSALGGVVNAISRHHEMHKHRHEGIRGQMSSSAGSNNGLLGAGVTAEYGRGPWMVWGGSGGQRTGDYSTQEGQVDNSKARISNGSAGLGWFGSKSYLSIGGDLRNGRYGIPFATAFHDPAEGQLKSAPDSLSLSPESTLQQDSGGEAQAVDVAWSQHSVRLSAGLQELETALRAVRFTSSYSQWKHRELEIFPSGDELVGTRFDNRQWVFRGELDQKAAGNLTGSFGVYSALRDYKATGAEALSPPVDQKAIAFFALEELAIERAKFQFGGRLEHTRYDPSGTCQTCPAGTLGTLPTDQVPYSDRRFTGLSAAAGARIELWSDGAFVANVSSSFRAPSLEELYNYGPHVGNLAFEIGNPNLVRERSNGFDLSLRQAGDRVRGEANFFFYHISDFVYGAPTDEIRDGLRVLHYEQGTSRFVGSELGLDFGVSSAVWLNLGLDMVDAQLTRTKTPLPRIPPLKGRIGFDVRRGGFSVRPEVVLAAAQDSLFPTETRTAGYGVVNLKASYTRPAQHFVHHFFFEIFNAGNELYRNHVSFIKDLAPEIGRGVKISYAMQFF
jgi:iron complex outermembrane receptor protein